MTASDTGAGDHCEQAMEGLHPDLRDAARTLGLELPALARAARASERMIKIATERLRDLAPPDRSSFDVVVLGSVARLEASERSDFDFLLVAHERPSDPRLSRRLLDAVDTVREDELSLDEPGATRMFGGVISAADLTERIGLEQDTNRTHSHRILLLEESRSIYRPEVHHELIRAIVERYLLDAEMRRSPVPRFLLNDILRYWRTLAVDYEAKRWEGLEQNWGLRYLKLRISRKIAFAGTLVSLFSCSDSDALNDHLVKEFLKPPLARFAQVHDQIESDFRDKVRSVLMIADRFAAQLEDREFRAAAKSVSDRRQMEALPELQEARAAAATLRGDLEAIFFESELLRDKSRHYLSF